MTNLTLICNNFYIFTKYKLYSLLKGAKGKWNISNVIHTGDFLWTIPSDPPFIFSEPRTSKIFGRHEFPFNFAENSARNSKSRIFFTSIMLELISPSLSVDFFPDMHLSSYIFSRLILINHYTIIFKHYLRELFRMKVKYIF